MFVAINNNEMNVPQVLDWINRTKNANNNVISPKFAMKILSKTNFYGHIKTVLKNIKENCKTKEEILPYKKFILSCVDRREMSDQAMADLMAMAKLCGCEKEFKVANGKLKIYGKFDCDNTAIVKSKEEFDALEGENLKVYFDADEVDLQNYNLSKVKALKFREGAWVIFKFACNLPKDLDVSMCDQVSLTGCDLEGLNLKFREGAEVNLGGAENLPKDLDVSMCSKVGLRYCDLEGLNLKFREGAEVNLSDAKNLPKDLDLSMCDKVSLMGCDLEGLNLKFREGAEVDLRSAKNLPKDLDVSMCDQVSLMGCDLEGLNLKFREGADVNLNSAKNLPKDLDVSMCSIVDLSWCNLEGLELKFREGAVVGLKSAINLPEVLDFSMCSEVYLRECNLSGVKEIKFRNMRQRDESCIDENYFEGEVVYASMFSSMLKRLGYDGMGE